MSRSLIFPDDVARARRGDPLTSHLAGDASQSSVPIVRAAVLVMLAMDVAEASGSELNELYQELREARGWPDVHRDSPRKRAGELASPMFDQLIVLNRDAKRGTEHIYQLPRIESETGNAHS